MTIEEFIKLPQIISIENLAKVLKISIEETYEIICELEFTFATLGSNEILINKKYVSALIRG